MLNQPNQKEARIRPTNSATGRDGFTMLELSMLLAVTGLLMLIVVPALARTQPHTAALQCLSNLQRLTAAWKMYSYDNDDRLLTAESSGRERRVWMGGWLSYQANQRSNWDVTADLPASPLWTYAGQLPSLVRCPADKSTVLVSERLIPRVRSVSMSHVFGNGMWLPATRWRTYASAAEIANPAKTFLFIDEHPDSINDGAFASRVITAETAGEARIIDYPGSLHNGACGISFTDGRAELHRWKDPRTTPPVRYSPGLSLDVPSPGNPDMLWLSERTTVAR